MHYTNLSGNQRKICQSLGYNGLFADYDEIGIALEQCNKMLRAEGCPENISIIALHIVLNTTLTSSVKACFDVKGGIVLSLLEKFKELTCSLIHDDISEKSKKIIYQINKICEDKT